MPDTRETARNLYRVTVRGLIASRYHTSYAVAGDAESAYRSVRDYLRSSDLGFGDDRELEKVELLAKEEPFDKLPTLFISLEGSSR